MKLHQKHGDFVRIGPNHLSINNPSAVAEVYGHKTCFIKSPFYDAFLQVRPVVFNARDVHEHSRKRRYINPAFSARALSDFEPNMNVELLGWKNQLLGMLKESRAKVDLAIWSKNLSPCVFVYRHS